MAKQTFESVLECLKENDSGKWDWEEIHCCLTGGDADLDPQGSHGIHLDTVDNGQAIFTVYGYKLFVGNDVSLNLTSDIENDDEKFELAHEKYMEEAELVVQGLYRSYDIGEQDGEWDGDDWVISFTAHGISVPLQNDVQCTAQLIVDKAREILTPWVTEMELADLICSQLAGWKDREGNNCPEGNPSNLAAWGQE